MSSANKKINGQELKFPVDWEYRIIVEADKLEAARAAIGQCLRERPDYRGRLFIETGRNRYELMFDCKRCEMSVVCRNRTE